MGESGQAAVRGVGAIEQLERARDERKATAGVEDAQYAQLTESLGVLYFGAGRYAEAEPLYREALALAERLFGERDQRTAAAASNLASLNHTLGRLGDAEQGYEQAVRILRQASGSDSPDVATAVLNLAVLYRETGRIEAAAQLVKEALSIRATAFGESSREFAHALAVAASLDWKAGRQAEAARLLERTLEIETELYGDGDPAIEKTRSWLAKAYAGSGQAERARELLIKSVSHQLLHDPGLVPATIEQVLQISHTLGDLAAAEPIVATAEKAARSGAPGITLARVLEMHAEILGAVGQPASARDLLQEACEIRLQVAPSDFTVLGTMTRLAQATFAAGDRDGARRLCRDIVRQARASGHGALVTPAAALLVEIGHEARDEDAAIDLNNVAELYRMIGDLDAAEPLYLEAIERFTAIHGRADPVTANTLNNLGLLYLNRGDLTRAEGPFDEALAILRSCAEPPAGLAFLLNNLAELHSARGELAKAAALEQESLDLRIRLFGEQSPEVANSLHQSGRLALATGHYAEARSKLSRALFLRRQLIGERHPDYASTLSVLAELFWKTGQYHAADPLIRLAHLIMEQAFGREHPSVAQMLDNIAVLEKLKGNFREAERLHQEAGEILRGTVGEGHPDYAINRNNLAWLYTETSNYDAAREHFLAAAAIQRACRDTPALATTLNNLALLLFQQGSRECLEFVAQALALRRSSLPPDHPDVAQSLNNAAALFQVFDPAKASDMLREAVRIRTAVLGENHPDTAESLNNLGDLLLRQERYAEAAPLLARAADIYRSGDRHPNLAQTLCNVALLAYAEGRERDALASLAEAAAIEDRLIESVFGIGSDSQRLDCVRRVRGSFDLTLSIVAHRYAADAAAVRGAFERVLKRKALATEALAAQRAVLLGGRYPEAAAELRELTLVRAEIAERALSGGETDPAASLRASEMERRLSLRIPELAFSSPVTAADVDAVAASLPRSTALIEFVNFLEFGRRGSDVRPGREPGRRYVAFVVHSGDPPSLRMINLGDASEVDRLAARFRQTVAGGRSARSLGPYPDQMVPADSAGEALRRTVFDALRPALGECKDVVIAPDGALSLVPFEALPVPGGGYLIDEFSFVYAGCGRDLLRPRAADGAKSDPAVAGAPDFDFGAPGVADGTGGTAAAFPGLSSFPPLDGAGEEAAAVAALLGVEPLQTSNVVKARIQSLRSPRILHLATHGFFLERLRVQSAPGDAMTRMARLANPLLRSGLALAGANSWLAGRPLPTEAGNGLLTGEDAAALDLVGTELVVLSACDTGVGETDIGEGVFGLRRAFLIAGARTLVMSVWKVPDQETRELMEAFYRALLRGEPRAQALRQARLSIRSKRPHPLFWGGFICQGDPSPLPALA